MSENKLARVCWNDECWRRPSGWARKSKSKDTHEGRNGYGDEEWLLDTTKRIGKYMYGFIQMPESQLRKHAGCTFNLSLYSINADTRQRWLIGSIRNVTVMTDVEQKRILREYQRRGWHDEMERQLLEVGAKVSVFRKSHRNNIKFRLSGVDTERPRLLLADESGLRAARYKLVSLPTVLRLGKEWEFSPGGKVRTGAVTVVYPGTQRATTRLHNCIQAATKAHLEGIYSARQVGIENSLPFGQSIDIVVEHDSSRYTFYEIKTSPSVRLCIRDALSQLLEYAYYPDAKRAHRLVVVGPHRITPEGSSYLRMLRKRFNIPVYYQFFDRAHGRLDTAMH